MPAQDKEASEAIPGREAMGYWFPRWVFLSFGVMDGLEFGSFSGDDFNLGSNFVHWIVDGEFSMKTNGDCHILPSRSLPKKRWNVDDNNLGYGFGVKSYIVRSLRAIISSMEVLVKKLIMGVSYKDAR